MVAIKIMVFISGAGNIGEARVCKVSKAITYLVWCFFYKFSEFISTVRKILESQWQFCFRECTISHSSGT